MHVLCGALGADGAERSIRGVSAYFRARPRCKNMQVKQVEVGDVYDAPNDLLWPQSGIVNPG